jgi:hypothetical protein
VKVSVPAVVVQLLFSSFWMTWARSTPCTNSPKTGTKHYLKNLFRSQKTQSVKIGPKLLWKSTNLTYTTLHVVLSLRDTSCFLLYRCMLNSKWSMERLIQESMTSSFEVAQYLTEKASHQSHPRIGSRILRGTT